MLEPRQRKFATTDRIEWMLAPAHEVAEWLEGAARAKFKHLQPLEPAGLSHAAGGA